LAISVGHQLGVDTNSCKALKGYGSVEPIGGQRILILVYNPVYFLLKDHQPGGDFKPHSCRFPHHQVKFLN
jgi:hypothetical protein